MNHTLGIVLMTITLFLPAVGIGVVKVLAYRTR